MCRVLVRWKSKNRALDNEVKWECSRRQRGDIVSVFPDGHEWGSGEKLPDYVSLDMEGVPISEMFPFTRPAESTIVDHRGKRFIKHRRRYNLQFDSFPKPVLDGLARDGKASISFAEVRGRILDKESGTRR